MPIEGIPQPGLVAPAYGDARGALPMLPVPVRFQPADFLDRADRFTPMENQGFTSHCVSFAAMECLEAHHWRRHGWQRDYDAGPPYAKAKKLDGIPTTPGTYEWAIVQACRDLGLVDHNVRVWECKSAEQIQWALMQDMLVQAGFRVNENWSSRAVNTKGKIGHEFTYSWGLHDVVVLGWSPWGWLIGNSWGRAWCHDGMAMMSMETFKRDCIGGIAWDFRRA